MLAKRVRALVSKKKQRYCNEKYDLDLSYIGKEEERIIAMGFPSRRVEGFYRNNIKEVRDLLETRHKDHYRIYNLCSERRYDYRSFHNRVKEVPIDDHNPPLMPQIIECCVDMQEWMLRDVKNVLVVHCKAGKGRTGLIICCFLIHSGRCQRALEALDFYAFERTTNAKGVTIASQRRYVYYYDFLIQNHLIYERTELKLIYLMYRSRKPLTNSSITSFIFQDNVYQKGTSSHFKLEEDINLYVSMQEFDMVLSGDIRVEFWTGKIPSKSAKPMPHTKSGHRIFHFWFNTFFIDKVDVHEQMRKDHYQSLMGGQRKITRFKRMRQIVYRGGDQRKASSSSSDSLFFNPEYRSWPPPRNVVSRPRTESGAMSVNEDGNSNGASIDAASAIGGCSACASSSITPSVETIDTINDDGGLYLNLRKFQLDARSKRRFKRFLCDDDFEILAVFEPMNFNLNLNN